MAESGSPGNRDDKLDKILGELEKLRLALDSLPQLSEKLHIENLSIGQIDFHLDNINIHEVSGALNIGITHGVSLNSKNNSPGKTAEKAKMVWPQGKKESSPAGEKKSPQYKIHFT